MVKDNHLFRGALILMIAGMLSKVLSALYRIPLQNLTGDFGYYIYQQMYPFIGILMMLSLYGFPAAVSKLAAEQKAVKKSLTFINFTRPILVILFSFSVILASSMFVFAPNIAKLVGDMNLTSSYQLMSLGFLLIPLVSFYRGYFQGIGDMRPTAYSQFFDQLFRVSIIIITAILISKEIFNIYSIGTWAVYATLIGGVISTFTLYVFKFKETKKNKSIIKSKVPWRYFINVLFMFGIIAALNHMILLLLQFADVFTLVPELINYGYNEKQAMEMKGVFDRGQPLIQFGAVLGSSFALALVPEIARKKETTEVIKDTLTFSFYLAAGATLGLIIILPEVNLLLFKNTNGTFSLQILMLAILLGSIAVTSNAILQSYGYFKQVTLLIISMFIIKYLLNYLLVSKLSILGSSIATISSLLFLCVLSLRILKNKLTHLSFFKMINWKAFILANIGMASGLLFLKYLFGDLFLTSRLLLFVYIVLIVVIGAIIYLFFFLRYNALSKRQLSALPFIQIILKLEKISKVKSR